MEQVWITVVTVLIGAFGCTGYFFLSNIVLDWIYPAAGPRAGANLNRAAQIRPWLFILPALVLMAVYLLYPVLVSIYLSLVDAEGDTFIGAANYIWLMQDAKFRESLFNNLMWLVFVPAASTILGLVAAGVTDRIRWGGFAKAVIFMPMAISFVGAAVIWKLVYEYRPDGQEQIGLLNAVWTAMGGEAQVWLTSPVLNSFLLMVVLVWIQTGFAMVILAAALRGIAQDVVEAAILDGASPLQIFIKIKIPQIWGTILVVWTTVTITVLKVFDIVLTMTNGQWGTQVLANLMFDWMFRGNDTGRASTVAIVIMLMVTPVMIWNIRNTLREGH
ncbi:sugar ABC transporter permease (plasmid) [Pseudorhodobacter turbinis]|uniref:Sugar ABC transporter permease n=1 Tax=Pseudorhodobacter turbinis TaxID=2500533 RepID=A0A4P8EI75_9RHOB|nr:sugar ABC transporter permease [Pseudorhodobacter turbinis]QCO56841.1 sugar ABC transporter permease [Pseudorhodobacter turbinis]